MGSIVPKLKWAFSFKQKVDLDAKTTVLTHTKKNKNQMLIQHKIISQIWGGGRLRLLK
jgi:hypothetical protein